MTGRIRRDSGHLQDQQQRDRKRKAKRPCGNPPAVPTGVVLTFQVTEARTHLRFTGKVKWDAVTLDEGGHVLDIGKYETQLRATNAAGVPVETEDSRARLRAHRKAPADRVRIDTATNPSGSTFRYVTRRAHGRLAGDSIEVKDCASPATYNGTFVVTSIVNSTTLEVNGGSSGVADCADPGVMIDDDDRLHVITRELPRPKTWYWQARVRAIDNHGCPGAWSAWTSPLLPWTGADPLPPTPTGLTLSFDSKDKNRHNRWRAIAEWNEVVNWDVPGGDREDDMAGYGVQIQKSSDGSVPDENSKTWHRYVSAKADSDADTTARAIRHQIYKRYYYRVRVRSVDRFGRRGAYTAWSAWQQPGSEAPPQPTLVTIFANSTNRVVVQWEAPDDPADADIIDRDIAYFQAQISTSPTFATIYKFDRYQHSQKKSFRIKDADAGGTFYCRVRSVNSEGDKSAWIPAKLDPGNSNPAASADGVTIGPGGGGGGDFAWRRGGPAIVKHYANARRTNTTGVRQYFKKARATCGDKDLSTGSPSGSALKFNLRRWVAAETSHAPVFDNGAGGDDDDRLKINAGTYKDVNGPSTFSITYLEPDEAVSVKVTSIGSTNPGSDWVVQLFMSPDP